MNKYIWGVSGRTDPWVSGGGGQPPDLSRAEIPPSLFHYRFRAVNSEVAPSVEIDCTANLLLSAGSAGHHPRPLGQSKEDVNRTPHESAPRERAERDLRWAELMEAGSRGIEGGHGVARVF